MNWQAQACEAVKEAREAKSVDRRAACEITLLQNAVAEREARIVQLAGVERSLRSDNRSLRDNLMGRPEPVTPQMKSDAELGRTLRETIQKSGLIQMDFSGAWQLTPKAENIFRSFGLLIGAPSKEAQENPATEEPNHAHDA